MKIHHPLVPLFLLFSATAVGEDKPREPFYSWGACPFECCTYREWQAEEPVVGHARRDPKSPVTLRLQKGEWVDALEGVVISQSVGVTRILKPVELGYGKDGKQPLLKLNRGDLLYPLYPQGEGSYLFWYQGLVYSDQVSALSADVAPRPDQAIQVLAPPRFVWWAKIRSRQGVLGWTNVPNKFGNTDRCS